MKQFLYFSFAGPIILFLKVMEFIVWDLISGWRWRHTEPTSNPVKPWMDENLVLIGQVRELQYEKRRLEEEKQERKN